MVPREQSILLVSEPTIRCSEREFLLSFCQERATRCLSKRTANALTWRDTGLSKVPEPAEGTVAYIADKDESLVCHDGKWVKEGDDEAIQNSDKSSSSGEKGGSSSSVRNDVEGSSDSRHSGSDPESSCDPASDEPAEPAEGSSSSLQSSSSVASSSSTGIVPPCKTETEDNCEYGVLKDSRDGKEYKTVKIGGWSKHKG